MPFQNTYTNAEKLLLAAEELAHTGECNAEEIYTVAHELGSHITSFATRVEKRRRLLDLAVLFYTHDKEVSPVFSIIFLVAFLSRLLELALLHKINFPRYNELKNLMNV